MPELGKKYTCYNCGTKFYDLGKAVPLCPKCSADQREAEEAPLITSSRGRRAAPAPVVEEPDEPEFAGETEAPAAAESSDDEEEIETRDEEPTEEDDEEEEEEY